MKISEIQMQSREWIADEIRNGGRFVVFTYTISLIIMTFKRPSTVYFLRNGESPLKHSWIYMLISFILGWWGIPFGLIYTVQSLYDGFKGVDVTADVIGEDNELMQMVYDNTLVEVK